MASIINKKEWTKEDTIELINAYEENSILWDSKSTEYRNRERKHKILQEIADKLSCTSEEVQRKLHNLRNQVSQELKKIRKKHSGDGTDDNYVTSWPYFKALQFLIPVLTVNQTQSSMATSSHTSQSTYEEEPRAEEQEPNATVEGEKAGSQVKKRSGAKRKDKDDENDRLFKQALETLQKPPDADDRFGEYVAMELKSLRSEYNKRKLKSEIRRAVARIADEDDNRSMYAASTSTSLSPGFLFDSTLQVSHTSTPMHSPPQVEPDRIQSPSCREYYTSFNQYTDL